VGQYSDSGISGDFFSGSRSSNSATSSELKLRDGAIVQYKCHLMGEMIGYDSNESTTYSRSAVCSAEKCDGEQTRSSLPKLATSGSNSVDLQSDSQCSMSSQLHLNNSTSGSVLSSSTSRNTSGLFAASNIEHNLSDIAELKVCYF